MKVKILTSNNVIWYKGFIGRVIEVNPHIDVSPSGSVIHMVLVDKCDDDIQDVLKMYDAKENSFFQGMWWIYKEDCEVVKEEKPLRVGDVVCFVGSKYEYDQPTITVVKIYMDCRSGYSVFDGVYFNKVTGGYTTIVGASVNAVERR